MPTRLLRWQHVQSTAEGGGIFGKGTASAVPSVPTTRPTPRRDQRPMFPSQNYGCSILFRGSADGPAPALEKVASTRGGEVGSSAITTARQEVGLSGLVESFQSAGHGGNNVLLPTVLVRDAQVSANEVGRGSATPPCLPQPDMQVRCIPVSQNQPSTGNARLPQSVHHGCRMKPKCTLFASIYCPVITPNTLGVLGRVP